MCRAAQRPGGPQCTRTDEHEEHVANWPAWGHVPAREQRWVSQGPLTTCSCCRTRVEAAGLAAGYRELCESCAGSFAQWGCD